METSIMDFILQGGSWAIGILAALVVGKQFISYITKDKEMDRQDAKERLDRDRAFAKEDNERVYSLMEKQNVLFEQQRETLIQISLKQVSSDEQNRLIFNGLKDTMDGLKEIQMLHTNRLDRIEDRQSNLEREIMKISDKL